MPFYDQMKLSCWRCNVTLKPIEAVRDEAGEPWDDATHCILAEFVFALSHACHTDRLVDPVAFRPERAALLRG
jgi:hypothetical protein